MCLTIPGQITKIKGNKASIKVSGGTREVNTIAVPDVKVGDWLLATTEFAVKKVDGAEAKEILDLLSGHDIVPLDGLDKKFLNILERASQDKLTKSDIAYLLDLKKGSQELEALYAEADVTRRAALDDFVCLHGIIEFSNHCQNNCAYCGLHRENKQVKRYRMSAAEIVKVALQAVNEIGYKMLVLQSGYDEHYTDDMLVDIVSRIKKDGRCFIFMSVGDRSLDCYRRLKEAGASGVLFRFETSNPDLYKKLHPEDSLKGDIENRRASLAEMKAMGYYVSSGPIIGLPGQTPEDLVNDILMMKEIGVGMVSMGPFVPSQGTPLADEPAGDVELSLKMIAVSRLAMPQSRIPITTALETLAPKSARQRGLQSGGNSLMFNLTPEKYRQQYKIYDNKFYGRDKDLEDFALYTGRESWQMLEKEFKDYI